MNEGILYSAIYHFQHLSNGGFNHYAVLSIYFTHFSLRPFH